MRVAQEGVFSHPGGREINEDALLRVPPLQLYAVADGMGGEGAGDVAAKLAIDEVKNEEPWLRDLFEGVAADHTTTSRLRVVEHFDALFNTAGRRVAGSAEERGAVGMATTLLVTAVVGNTAYLAHVGDSRGYLLRQGRLLRLTEDHSVAEFRYRRGRMTPEEYQESPERHVLYQAVGSGPEVDVDLAEVRLADGDVLLLCTDGLVRAVDETQLIAALQGANLRNSMDRLLQHALEQEPPDNLTAVALRISAETGDQGLEEMTDAMAACFLFARLTEQDRLVVAPYVEEVHWERGDLLTAAGGTADHLGILVSGEVEETSPNLPPRTLRSGDWFGEAALSRPGHWRRTRTALGATRMLWFSRERFRELARYKPALGGSMAVALAERLGAELRDAEDRLERIAKTLRS